MEDTKKPQSLSVEELKIKGNECVKDGKYIEAVLHYTQAIKMDPKNYILYSNRSYAFLQLDQRYLSLLDANETVRLQPQWAKGYFRRAEVEAAGELYFEAILSYTRALQLEPDNPKIIESIKKITDMQKKKMKDKQNLIWICTCIGFIIGISIVIMDYTMTANPTLANPFSMVAFTIALAGLGWAIGKGTTLISSWRAGIQQSPDLFQSEENEKEASAPEKKTKYSKAQARQRYKQGKH